MSVNTPRPQFVAAPPESGPLTSKLSGDPDMLELIQLFVEEIPQRSRLVEEYWQRREFTELRRLAHQLKGASGGYGFPQVGQAAAGLEQSLAGAVDAQAELDLNTITAHVEELLGLCKRVSAS